MIAIEIGFKPYFIGQIDLNFDSGPEIEDINYIVKHFLQNMELLLRQIEQCLTNPQRVELQHLNYSGLPFHIAVLLNEFLLDVGWVQRRSGIPLTFEGSFIGWVFDEIVEL